MEFPVSWSRPYGTAATGQGGCSFPGRNLAKLNKYIEKELRPTIMSSIDPGQFCFIPGSSTTSNINAPPLAVH